MTQSPLILITTGSKCDNYCSFCVKKPSHFFGNKDMSRDILMHIDRLNVASKVVIGGLEPLSDPDLIPLIQTLRTHGVRQIRLETNGIHLAGTNLVNTLVKAGVTEISVFLPAVSKSIYHEITKNSRGFEACLEGLRKISECPGIEAHCTVPVCHENASHLIDILDHMSGMNIHSVLLDISETHSFWAAEDSSQIMQAISQAVSHGVANGIPVNLKGTRVHQVSSFSDGRFIREKSDESLLLTYFKPGRKKRKQIFSLDIRLTYRCNERCVFCAAHQMAREPDPALIRKKTKSLFARGIPRLCLEGGEPTLSPLLPELLHAARNHMVHERIVMTNALRLADKALAHEIFNAGANRFFVSLHGPNPDIADAITQTPGAFQKTVSGIHHLLELGAATSLIYVMTASNLAFLPSYVKFVAKEFGAMPVLLSVASPYLSPTLDSRVIPTYKDMRQAMIKAFKIADKSGIPISGMEEQHRPPECAFPDMGLFFRNLFAPLEYGPDLNGFMKPERCASCTRNNTCPGVKDFYAKAHGTKEIQPYIADASLS